MSPIGHGTAMAGIIAARGGGPDHVLGIAPGAKIYPVGLSTTFQLSDIAVGIKAAVDHGAKVINISAGSGAVAAQETLDQLTAAVRYALDHDVVIVSAVGNTDAPSADRRQPCPAPANIPGVLAVASALRSGHHDPKSETGPEVLAAAPGEDIVTTLPLSITPNGFGTTG